MGKAQQVVIVGAGLAGVRTAEGLRRAGATGSITLVSAEPHLPYDRPPLSKEVLRGDRAVDAIKLREEDFFTENKIDLRLGVTATGLDTAARQVTLDDGTALGYDQLVVATGLAPKRLPIGRDLAGVHVLRTVDDVLAVRADLDGAESALVVGAGFIGCEAAAALRALDLRVTLVEPQPAPLAAALGEQVGKLVARLHVEAGVDLRCGLSVTELLGEGRVTGARLSDGTELRTDLVLSGIGSAPLCGWLAGSGLEIGDGVLCDEFGRTSDPRVWAVGDVAAWRQRGLDTPVRNEHWTGAGEQATIVANCLLGAEPSAHVPVPYFWSDQHGLKIQALGHPSAGDTVRMLHDDGRKFLAAYLSDGIVTGVVGCGMAGRVMKLRPLIVQGAPESELPA